MYTNLLVSLLLTIIILIISLYYFKSKRKLVLLVGPSGAGKTQFVQSLLNRKVTTVSSMEATEYEFPKCTVVDIPGHSQLQFLKSRYQPTLVILFVKDKKDIEEFECPVYFVASDSVTKELGIESITLERARELINE